jgi:type I restriction enzyme, S subunit
MKVKNNFVDWLTAKRGQGMADEWRSSTWGEEISLEYGKALRGYDAVSGAYRVFGSNGPIGWTTEALTPGPGVILGRKGAYRGVQYSADPFYVIDTAYYVSPKTELDMRWLYYAIQHYKLGEIDDGSPIPSTTRAAVYVRGIEVPPPDEQRAIAHILGTLDDKIELNRRMNATLEAMARALFKSWFVDFDPVRAKAEGRETGLPREIADLFPDGFEESAVGDVPMGWRVGTVEDMAEVSSGKRPGVRYDEITPEASVPLWGGNGPMAFVLSPLVDYPVLLTGRVGTLGSVFRITSPCWPSDNTLILKARGAEAFEYLFLQLKRIDFSSLNRGSTQPLLTQTDLKMQPTLLPPTAVLMHFSVMAKRLYDRLDASNNESRTLAALRDALLPKLISGAVRVGDAERFVA